MKDPLPKATSCVGAMPVPVIFIQAPPLKLTSIKVQLAHLKQGKSLALQRYANGRATLRIGSLDAWCTGFSSAWSYYRSYYASAFASGMRSKRMPKLYHLWKYTRLAYLCTA